MRIVIIGNAVEFQLTRLMRGVTFRQILINSAAAKFQLTRLMRGVTPRNRL